MGVIDSLSAGYRYLGWRLYLLLIPVLLDLLLWLAPRMSIAPLFQQAARLYTDPNVAQTMSPQLIAMMQEGLNQTGQNFNLLDLLVSSSLLHVPSLLIMLTPLPGVAMRTIGDPLMALGLSVLFGLLSLLVGALFIDLLAHQLPIGVGDKTWSFRRFSLNVLRHWFKLTLFVILTAVCLVAIYIPVSISATLLMLLNPGLGVFLIVLVSGLLFVLFFYLYFVPAGLIMDNLGLRAAVVQSFRLVRNNFWSTIGFFLLTYLISGGFGLIFERLATYTPLGTFLSIVANAYLGTGMALALLIFYRTQLLRTAGVAMSGGQL